jgi:hypothetical protein
MDIFVYNSSVHIPDSFKLVEEFHGQLKIGGGKKKSAPRLEGKRKKKKLEKKMARSTGVHNPPKLYLTKRTFDVFILISVK